MGQYDIHVNGKHVGRGDNCDYPSEAQYYAFDATDAVTAGQPLALGALYHYWTCTCQGRANGPVVQHDAVAPRRPSGATNLKVGARRRVRPRRPDHGRHRRGARPRRSPAIGTAGATGTGITVTPGAADRRTPAAPAVLDYAGPSGADHEGRRRPRRRHARDVRHRRHLEGLQGARVHDRHGHDPQRRLRRQGRALRRARRAARLGHGRLRRLRLAARLRDRPAPAPAEPAARDVQPPRPGDLASSTTRRSTRSRSPRSPTAASSPTSARSSRPCRSSRSTTASPAARWSMQTSYRLNNTTLRRGRRRGRRPRSRSPRVTNFVVGDKITVDQAANGFGEGDPETRTITAVGTAGATGTGITLDAPLSRAHANARFVEGSRAGTSTHDTQGSNLGWWYTEKDGAADRAARTCTGAGATCRSSRPARGRTLTADDIAAVVQHQSRARRRASATFDSDNPTLNAVFDADAALRRSTPRRRRSWTRRRARRASSPATRSTSPTRTWPRAGDRNATARAIREIVYSGTHAWKAASSGYCTAAQLPCSFPSIGTPGPRERGLPQRRQHARHPGLHGVRPGVGLALLPAERRQGDAGRQLRPS